MNKLKFPIKTPIVIAFILIWNALIIPNFLMLSGYEISKNYAFAPIIFLFVISLALIFSTKLQKFFLHKESTFGDIRKYVYLLLIISVCLFLLEAI